MSLKIRRGTDSERVTITPAEGELIYTTDTKLLYVGDGTTSGGRIVTGSSGGGTGFTGSQGDVGFTGSRGLQGDVGYVGSASTVQGPIGYTGSATRIPTGGTTGQVLSKISGTDYDVSWSTISGGSGSNGGILTSDLDTDIYSIINTDTKTVSIGNVNYESDLSIFSGNTTFTPGIQLNTIISGSPGVHQWGPTLKLSSSNGTFSAPTALTTGDLFGQVSFGGYINAGSYGVVNGDLASIRASIDNPGNLTNTIAKAKIEFYVVDDPDTDSIAIAEFKSNGVFSAPVLKTGSYNGSGSYPVNPLAGMIIFDSSNNHFYGYNGTIWKQLDN
jgi:hypothetical protein